MCAPVPGASAEGAAHATQPHSADRRLPSEPSPAGQWPVHAPVAAGPALAQPVQCPPASATLSAVMHTLLALSLIAAAAIISQRD